MHASDPTAFSTINTLSQSINILSSGSSLEIFLEINCSEQVCSSIRIHTILLKSLYLCLYIHVDILCRPTVDRPGCHIQDYDAAIKLKMLPSGWTSEKDFLISRITNRKEVLQCFHDCLSVIINHHT